jgi:hypothetical protein
MKKQLLTLLIVATSLIACKKDPTFGDIEVTVGYLVSSSVGQKPDVGAKVFLFKQEGKDIKYSTKIRDGILEYNGQATAATPLYSAVVNAEGIAKLSGVPFGDYILVAGSKGRATYSIKFITTTAEMTVTTKNFGDLSENKPEGEPWGQY